MSSNDVAEHQTATAAAPRGGSIAGRVSTGHVVMVVAALLAGLLNYALLRSGDDRVLVSVAATDLPAGHVLGSADLATAQMATDDEVLSSLLRPESISGSLGSVTTTTLRAGDLIRAGDLVAVPADGLRTMSVPIDAAHAAGGALRAGDRVDVITVVDGRASYALTGVEVRAVSHGAATALAGGDALTLSLAVDDAGALRMAAAMAAGAMEIIRTTGSPATAAGPVELRAEATGPLPGGPGGTAAGAP